MTFEQYLAGLGRLYVQGVTSDVHPNLLRRLGGSLALAGRDAQWIRFEEDGLLGFIDVRRRRADIDRIARRRWREYRAAIERRIAAGEPPRAAVERLMRGYGTIPHAPRQVEQMLRPSTGPVGTLPAWLYDIAVVRRRIERGGEIMTDLFGGLTATAYLIATAEDWMNATPEEWDRAFDAGEIGQTFGEIIESAGGALQARQTHRSLSRSAPSRSPTAVERSITPDARAARGAPTPRERSTGPQAQGTAARGTPPREQAPPPAPRSRPPRQTRAPRQMRTRPHRRAQPQARPRTRPRPHSQSSPADDLNIDAAFDENAPFQTSRLRRAERPRHRRGPFAGQSYQSLDTLLETLPQRQRRAAQRLVNRFPPSFLAVWRSLERDIDRRRMQEVRRLWHAGRHAEARALARDAYDSYRNRFWQRVRRHPELLQMLRDAGLVLEGGPTTAPFWRLPNGTKEVLSIEHTDRVADSPWRAIDGSGMRMVPARENSRMLEFIRENDRFQNPPSPPSGAADSPRGGEPPLSP